MEFSSHKLLAKSGVCFAQPGGIAPVYLIPTVLATADICDLRDHRMPYL